MIPKTIHLCWLSGDEYPENISKCIDSIYKNLTDYEIKIWSKDNFDITSVQWVKETFEEKKYAFAADYLRFWVLYNYGGIYLDSDVEVLQNFDSLLNAKNFIGFEYLNIPEAAVIGAEKGCTWIKKCLDWYENKSFYDVYGGQKKDIAPLLVKLILEKMYKCKIEDLGKIYKIEETVFYPYYYFSPKNYFTEKISITQNTVCIHRFASAWGPNKKKRFILILHSFVIFLIGKKQHDKIYRFIKPLPQTFNGDTV